MLYCIVYFRWTAWFYTRELGASQYSHISSQLTIKSLVFPFQQCPVYPLISKL